MCVYVFLPICEQHVAGMIAKGRSATQKHIVQLRLNMDGAKCAVLCRHLTLVGVYIISVCLYIDVVAVAATNVSLCCPLCQ